MNCPHCGASNSSSRVYCAVCGGALSRPAPPAEKRSRQVAITTWLLLGLALALLISGVVIAATAGPEPRLGLLLFALYAWLGVLPGIVWLRQVNRAKASNSTLLWRYRMVFIALALLAWPGLLLALLLRSRVNSQFGDPLKVTAIMSAAVVCLPLLLALVGGAFSGAAERRTVALRQQQSELLQQLAITWGPGVLQCDPLATGRVGRPASLPTVASQRLLLVDVTFPQAAVSDWQRQLPVSQQATSKNDLTWVVCLQPDTRQAKCEYKGGPSLDYTTLVLNIRLVYAAGAPFAVQDRVIGRAPDTCPADVHTVNGGIDYVIKADGSQAKLSEVHLDQQVNRAEVQAKIESMINASSLR